MKNIMMALCISLMLVGCKHPSDGVTPIHYDKANVLCQPHGGVKQINAAGRNQFASMTEYNLVVTCSEDRVVCEMTWVVNADQRPRPPTTLLDLVEQPHH